MRHLNRINYFYIVIICSVLTLPAFARDYSYMDDRGSPTTPTSGSTASGPSVQDNSILGSVIDAAVTTGVESVDQSMERDNDSFTGRFYKNLKKDVYKDDPYYRDRYEREYRSRRKEYDDEVEWDKDDKNRKKWLKKQRKEEKKRQKQWRKEAHKKHKKHKKWKKYNQESDREWREEEYERRREWQAERREYLKERNEAYRDWREQDKVTRQAGRNPDYDARQRARRYYSDMQKELESR